MTEYRVIDGYTERQIGTITAESDTQAGKLAAIQYVGQWVIVERVKEGL